MTKAELLERVRRWEHLANRNPKFDTPPSNIMSHMDYYIWQYLESKPPFRRGGLLGNYRQSREV